jgi:hypothetical protein
MEQKGGTAVDCKQVEKEINDHSFAVIHCPDYKQRQEIKSQLSSHNDKWIVKSMLHRDLESTYLWKCPECNKCAPERLCRHTHYMYSQGPDESDYTCPLCDRTFSRSGDDDFVWHFKAKNVVLVTPKWKGRAYYGRQFAAAKYQIITVTLTPTNDKDRDKQKNIVFLG